MEQLTNGRGFKNPNLTEEQKEAVLLLLRNEAERMIKTVLGPAGTGKSAVIVEAIAHLVEATRERCGGDAL